MSKSFVCEPFNLHKWFSSELLFTLRAVEWLKGSEPEKMKPDLNLSQLDEEFEEINELDKCFFEPVSIIVVTPGKRKRK